MAKSIANPAVKFTADVSPYVRGVKSAQAATSSFKSKGSAAWAGAAKAIKAGSAVIAGAATAAAGAIAALTAKGLKEIDQISKLSDELGFSTEALATYQLATELTGTKQENLTKGLQRLVRRLGEAKQGYGEAVKGLKALGFSADELTRVPVEEALGRIMDRINALPTSTERAAAAYAFFGRQGQELQNFLALGSKGLAQVRKEADLLGLTFDRLSGAKVENANDALAKARKIVVALSRAFAVALAPFIEVVSNNLIDAGKSAGGFGNIATRAVGWVIKAAAKLADAWSVVKGAFNAVKAAVLLGLGLILGPLELILRTAAKVADVFGLDFASSITAAAEAISAFRKEGAEAARSAAANYQAGFSGESSRRAERFVSEIQRQADERAKETLRQKERDRAELQRRQQLEETRKQTRGIDRLNQTVGRPQSLTGAGY